MSSTLTIAPTILPAPAARTAPAPWPRPEPTPDEAADLFVIHDLEPNPFHFLREDAAPCGCLVGVLLIDACGGYGRARATIHEHGSCLGLALVTGWDEAFVDGLNCGFTTGRTVDARAYFRPFRGDDSDFCRGLTLGAAAHQVLRDRGAMR